MFSMCLRQMLEARKSAKMVVYEEFIIERLVQEAVSRYEDWEERYLAYQMFVGLSGGFSSPEREF